MPTPNYGNMPYAAPDGTPLYNPDGTRAPTPEAAPAPAPNYAPAPTMFTANCVYRRKDILVALSAADDSASINVSVDNRWVGDAKGHHRQAIDRNGMGRWTLRVREQYADHLVRRAVRRPALSQRGQAQRQVAAAAMHGLPS